MSPAVAFPRKYELTARSPEQLIPSHNPAESTSLSFISSPELPPLTGGDVYRANRPGRRGAFRLKHVFLLRGWNANERERMTIRGPSGLLIAVGAGIRIFESLRDK